MSQTQTKPPLSADLLSSYLQLKHGTETLAGWLAQEAVTKCAYKLTPPTEDDAGMMYMRERARKKAQQAKANCEVRFQVHR